MNKIKKIHHILKEASIDRFYYIIVLITIASVFEFLGISLIVPFLAILSNKESRVIDYLPENFQLYLNDLTDEKIFLYGITLFFIIYLFKSIYLIFFNYNLNKFVFKSEASLCHIIFKKYLNSPYLFHLKQNSAFLLRNLTEEIHLFAEAILLQGLVFIGETFITILLIGFMLYINPQSTILIIISISVIVFFYLSIMKGKIKDWGLKRQQFGGLIIKQINEGLGSIKEIILYKKQPFFSSILKNFAEKKASSSILQNTFATLPRLTFEFFAISAILIVSLFMLNFNYKLVEVIQFVIVFGIICFRLLPASNRILNFVQLSIYHKAVIDVIYDELFLSSLKNNTINNKIITKEIKFKNKIKIENLSFKYSEGKNKILDNISFDINKNESIGIMGDSGSGKSTIINILMGLIEPTKGNIYCDGVNVFEGLDQWQSKISFVPQDVFLINDTIRKNIAFGLDEENIDDRKIDLIIERIFLKNFIDELPKGTNTIIGERGINISGGQKQRLGIARALYRAPEILILDESTNSLDKNTENKFMTDLFKIKKDLTLIFISHNKNILNDFNKIVEINKNGIVKIK